MLTARAWQPENMPHKAPVGTHKPLTQSKPSSHSWVRKVFSSSIFIFGISFPFICEKQTTKCHLLLETKRWIPPKCRIFLDSWCKAKAPMTYVIYSMILNVLVPALVQAALISELVIPAATSSSQSVLDQCALLRRRTRAALKAVLSLQLVLWAHSPCVTR